MKKYLLFILSIFLFLFVSCGGGTGQETTTQTPAQTTTNEPIKTTTGEPATTTPTPTTTTAVAPVTTTPAPTITTNQGSTTTPNTTTVDPVTTTPAPTTTTATTTTQEQYVLKSVVWGDDYKSATLVFALASDATKEQTFVVDVSYEITKQPSCTEEGKIVYKAIYEGETYTKEVKLEKLEHKFEERVVAPTYEAAGYTRHTCSACGYHYDDTPTAQLVHTYSQEWSHDENKHYHACLDEGYETLKVDEADHTFGEGVVTAPSYEAAGYTRYTCTVCGYYYDDNETAQLVHTYSQEWSHDENKHYHVCLDSGFETLRGNEADHAFNGNVVAPSYEAAGYTRHTCSVCGYYFDDTPTAQLVHTYSNKWSYDANKHYHACTDQGFDSLKVDEADHEFGDWHTTKDPTTISTGEKERECSVCGFKQVKEIAMLDPYTVTLDLNGGTSESITSTTLPISHLDKSFFKFDLVKTGFGFRGWAVNGTQVFDNEGNIVNEITLSNGITFVAMFEPKLTLTISYALYNSKTDALIEAYTEKPLFVESVSETADYFHNETVNLTSTTTGEYVFAGWYNGTELVSSDAECSYQLGTSNLTLEARFKKKLYVLTITKNVEAAGNITTTLEKGYFAGDEITIETTSNDGYTFAGWYAGENQITTELSYTFNMPSSNISYEARWLVEKYTIIIDNQAEGLIITGVISGNEYDCGSTITLTSSQIPAGSMLVWKRNDGVEALGNSYTFIVPSTDITITITLERSYEKNGDKIYFGTYPQTKLSDNTIIAELNNKAGTLPTSTNLYSWTDYNYYSSSTITSYMYYQDIDLDDDGNYDYRGVYFTKYRSYVTTLASNSSKSYQDDNGYSNNKVYWFSYDPIEWNILKEEAGKVYIIANLLLDSQEFYPNNVKTKFDHNGGNGFASNYELSNIRKWLNDTFYNTAFNELQKALIETTIVDNSAGSMGQTTSGYACNDTNDKIFLLSYKEADTYYLLDEARQAQGSDYAKAQGLNVNNSYSGYLLRSPYYQDGSYSEIISRTGSFSSLGTTYISYGIRPVCVIDLKLIGASFEVNGGSEIKFQEVGVNSKITRPEDPIRTGYTFIDWYTEPELENVYDFDTVLNEKIVLYAKWEINKYTITLDVKVDGVEISGITDGGEYEYDNQITLMASNNIYGFTIRWLRSDGLEYVGDSWSFRLPAYNLTIEIAAVRPYTKTENKVYFGTYPQTNVTDSALISELNNSAGTLPTSTNTYNWTSYGYYNPTAPSEAYMFYIDIDYDNNGTYDYRGIYLIKNRPYQFGKTDSYQDENGYKYSRSYWFKYEPIEWNILSYEDDKALIIANLLLDSQEYNSSSKTEKVEHNGGNGFSNNYELSNIRKWLNDNFYNMAFSETEKQFIETTLVCNDHYSTGYSRNIYTCGNTRDKLFLLSNEEINIYYPTAEERKAMGTDYAKAQGLYVSNEYSSWLLRSPEGEDDTPGGNEAAIAYAATYDGNIAKFQVYLCDNGVRPALVLNMAPNGVIFETNGGSEIQRIDVEYNTKLARPEDPIRVGYTFVDWYTEPEFENAYNFDTKVRSLVKLYAKWEANKYTINIDIQAEGVVVAGVTSGNEYDTDARIELSAFNVPTGYTIKWLRSDGDEYVGDVYAFNVPPTSITIEITITKPYKRDGNNLYFGSYPQGEVTDTALISELNALADVTREGIFSDKWTKYEYYVSSSISKYLMSYIDIDYDQNGTYDYRGVCISMYRPYKTNLSSTKANSHQDEGGYITGEAYWFKYEPIEWSILSEENGQVFIFANFVLDGQEFYASTLTSAFNHNGGSGYANNYELSNIRKWLNDTFYNTAFNDLEKMYIKTVEVDNSLESTGDAENNYICNNTNDKIFLLSKKELDEYRTYITSKGLTKYSSSQGALNSWLLRTPCSDSAIKVSEGDFSTDVNYTWSGICPACVLEIEFFGAFFETNGGSDISFKEVGKDSKITRPKEPIKTGYTFIDWYTEPEFENVYDFDIVLNEKIVLYAKWEINSYTITIDNQAEGVEISGAVSGSKYEYGTHIELAATNIPNGYTIEWKRSDGLVHNGEGYMFDVQLEDLTIEITLVKPYTRDENKIYFGTYPQTEVTDNELKTALNNLAGTRPTPTELYNWTDYNYYIEGNITSYMYYQDIDYDNDGTLDYRGVYFTQYRPIYYYRSSSTSTSFQENNGYSTNTIYWFNYDPIEWDVLAEEDGKVLIIANLMLDSQEYYPSESSSTFEHNGGTGYVNNYELSNIRKWLNDTFYNTAFDSLERKIIEVTEVDNSSSSFNQYNSKFACNNTYDKIFLLSFKEIETYYSTEEERIAQGTDYAKAQGLASSDIRYDTWWLRSPEALNSRFVYLVIDDGEIVGNDDYNNSVFMTANGVRPVCWITL